MIAGGPAERQTRLFPPLDVVTRASSDTLAVDDPVVEKALSFIRKQATAQISVQQLVDHLPISRRSLERRFQSALDRTPHEVITLVQVQMAKRYLANTNWLMRQVAARSGFTDAAKLSSWFSRITGMTPTEYRRKFRTP
jgi:LacI family transcriptional regulator